MDPFFQQNPYKADARSDLENDAKLALHLVLYLLSTQDPDDGTWRGLDVGTTLRITCHALEALHLLGWEISAGAIELGIGWLINLSDVVGLASEEADSIRLYPSRFKTLARLGEVGDPQLKNDFDELEEHLDEEGLLRGVMANQLLGSMVYVDCLDHLANQQVLPILSYERQEHALKRIHQEVRLWYEDLQQNTQHSHITTMGDLSYAMDILFRFGKLSKQDETDDGVLIAALISTLEPFGGSPHQISSDALYCGIQLATHFPQIVEAIEAVQSLIRYLRTRYERLDLKKEPPFFHPLVLRVLLSYHGDQLKAEMIRLLLERERRHLEFQRQSMERGIRDDFTSVIKNRFEVEIADIQPLTGGITQAKVFRIHFLLKFTSLTEENEVQQNTYQPHPRSLVIKSGSLGSFQRSISRFRNLPDLLKPFFAKQVAETQILSTAGEGPYYLIMEDLTYMRTFQDVLARIDQGRLSKNQQKELGQACATITASLFTIYDQTKQDETDFFGPQLSRLYMSSLEKNLIRMCRSDRFPHLKSWLRGFWLGRRKYRSIEYYLSKLESHKAKLKIPHLMLIHGDCHSRNIMLDRQLSHLKLIDLDYLDYDGDYIKDIALLIEDVCVFRFIFDEGYRYYLHKGSSRFTSFSTEPKLIENKIEYPPFSSAAVKLFQQHMLQQLEAYAQKVNDYTWKERLWLALAAYLMSLVRKQSEKGYATVVYVEAVKLLDELVAYLDKGVPLAKIPFTGEHPAGVELESNGDALTLPTWYRADTLLAEVHDRILALDPAIKCELTSSGRVTQYFATNPQRPFAIIDGKKQPAVLLACSPRDLNDPVGMAQDRETNSAFQTILSLSQKNNPAVVLDLTRQAFDLNS